MQRLGNYFEMAQAYLGPLPRGFLRLEEYSPQQQQEAADQQAALALQQLQGTPQMIDPRVGRLSITIAQVYNIQKFGNLHKKNALKFH